MNGLSFGAAHLFFYCCICVWIECNFSIVTMNFSIVTMNFSTVTMNISAVTTDFIDPNYNVCLPGLNNHYVLCLNSGEA